MITPRMCTLRIFFTAFMKKVFGEYAEKICKELGEANVRAEIDKRKTIWGKRVWRSF